MRLLTDRSGKLTLPQSTDITSVFLSLILVPAPGFTQRATIDPTNDEIHVFSVSSAYHLYIMYQLTTLTSRMLKLFIE